MRRVSANALTEHAASANSPSDIIHVHERRSAVLGIARCATGPAALAWVAAPWTGVASTDRTADSLHALVAGRTRVVFLWDVGVRAPEEKWLRANAVVSHDIRMGWYRILDFRPINSKTF
jgi:hypothetical protein